jgi:hypothetical protein
MPLNEPDRAWVREQIREQILKSQQGESKVANFFKQWLPLMIAGGVVIWLLNEWSGYVTFRTHTNDKLEIIEKDSIKTTTAIQGIQQSIQNLNKVQPILLLQSAVSQAKISNISAADTQIDQANEFLVSLKETRVPLSKTFFESAVSAAHQLEPYKGLTNVHTVSQTLAEYRSSLNPEPVLPKRIETALPKISKSTPIPTGLYDCIPPVAYAPGLLLVDGGGSGLDCRSRRPNEDVFVSPSPPSIDSNPLMMNFIILGGTQTLDFFKWKNVTFVNMHIKYTGHAVVLENVRFVNCTFDVPADAVGMRLTEYAALEPMEALKVG